MWFAARPHQSPTAPIVHSDGNIELLARRYAAELLRVTRCRRSDLPQLSTPDYMRVVQAVEGIASGLELNAGQSGQELWKTARHDQGVEAQVSK